ncbi:hypothetical protein OZ410_03870 [Robiginitalea sp. M366]|uniref:tetratricopeptide repeat protein n=1 Tax=Robiginitalea aestuariiviva TaxID=3036903 RepID=UPI00240E149F|nr:tetratricopeptide repeat protein [Robiginitalea aestuariiviva]MDG1571439.1 hypothetical protein [Robiginitalea aestuariiviva]
MLLACMLAGRVSHAQDIPSAELFLEAYTDAFQEAFFEALREKGIENYDRARDLLYECQKMEPDNPVVDHELARVLAAAQQWDAAREHALAAVKARPEEYWYLHTLMRVLQARHQTEKEIQGVPLEQPAVRENLARWYVEQEKGKEAQAYLEGLPETGSIQALRQRAAQLATVPELAADTPAQQVIEKTAPSEDEQWVLELTTLEQEQAWPALLARATEAVERYPLQPQFYFFRGLALLELDRASEALVELETGESLLLEPGAWGIRMYQALEKAHRLLGHPEKAKWYADKIKTGL